MDLTLKVWRQDGPGAEGGFETHDVRGISEEMSFLEMLDIVNDRLTVEGREPIRKRRFRFVAWDPAGG